jgi:hypothetical protein
LQAQTPLEKAASFHKRTAKRGDTMATAQDTQSAKDGGLLIQMVGKPVLTPILGFIEAPDVVLDESCPSANNNTRWIFDVDGARNEIIVRLLDPRSKRPLTPELMSISLLPRCLAFYEAKPFVEYIVGGSFSLRHVSDAKPCNYRVAVDVLHSATR